MKKDIAWLKKEIGTEMMQLEPNRKERWSDVKYQTLRNVCQKIYQLDEPEVLSQDWIDKYQYVGTDPNSAFVYVKDLQNLLVPKQGELETKIQELIESYKQEEDAYSNPENGWISGFIEDLKNLVAEEPLYHALIKGHELVRNSSKYWIHDTEYQGDVFVGHRIQMLPRFKERLTMPDWNELGINDSNADFVKVDK